MSGNLIEVHGVYSSNYLGIVTKQYLKNKKDVHLKEKKLFFGR